MESWKLAFLLGLGCQVPMAAAQVRAFEGAEGFGAFATGARTSLSSASIYRVTNLNDDGVGSFRDAVRAPNRFVVFDVGGIVNLGADPLTFASNLTIAGQTAPGGFSVYDNRAAFHGANNLISRHWAVRLGRSQGRDADAAGLVRGTNMIFDHMSITWGVDGTFDINPDSGATIDNLTIQSSIIGQGLDTVGHSTGGLMTLGTGKRFSIIKSLLIDNATRNPKVRGENEFINNVVYGYEQGGYLMGDTGATSHANAEGNYFIHGEAQRFDHTGALININPGAPFSAGSASFNIFGRDNWVDTDRDGVLDGTPITSYPGSTVLAARNPFPTVASMTAQQAVQYAIDHVGASIIRDAVDQRLADEVASYGTIGKVLVRETELFNGYGTDAKYLNPRARLVDTDADGMPDNWEASKGLNPNGAVGSLEWRGLNAAGYTRLEEYLNELGADGETILSAGGDWSNAAATWNGAAPTLADHAIVAGNLGVAGGNAFARRLSVSGDLTVSGGTLDVFDTATVGRTLSLPGGTTTLGRLLLGSPTSAGSLTLAAGQTLQAGPVGSGGAGGGTLTFDGGTLRALGSPNVSVATVVTAAGGTIDTTSYSGTHSGRITGAGKLTKLGAGTLTLSGNNAFAGGIDLTGNLKLTHSNAAGTGAITLVANGSGQVQLGNGVTVANTILSNNTFESLDVPDAGATAAFAGNLTRVTNQVRIRASGAGSTLNLTGATNAGSQIFILSTGNVFVKGTGSITSATGAIGRGGTVTNFTVQDNAAVNIGASSMGGGQATTSTTINVLGNATFSTGAANFDLLSTSTATSASELNLDGGTTTVGGFAKTSVGAAQTSKLNFNGGTLRYGGAAGNGNFLPALAGVTTSVEAGGARIDDNGQAITIAAPLVHLAGLATVDGGLTKLGAGTLTLAGANSYNGATAVNAGRLLVNGAVAGAANVAANATLGGNGSIAGVVNVAGNGILSPGNSPGILNVGGVALSAGADFVAELDGTVAGSTYDQLNVAGGVSLNGADLLATLGYVPAAGDALFIVKNDAADAVTGRFAGLAEGSQLSLTSTADGQNYAFTISYFGNAEQGLTAGGNDVVLTRLTAVPEPAALATLGLAVATGLRRRRRR